MTTRSIAARAAAHQQSLAESMPSGITGAIDEERRRLKEIGVPQTVASPGTPMPDGKVIDIHGRQTTLCLARGGKAAVIVFYRGGWCPYCSIALTTYQEHLLPTLQANNVELIAISPQKADNALSMRQRNNLSFSVLSDPGNGIAKALGILSPPASNEVRAVSATLGLDVAGTNADGTDELPLATTVVVDADGVIRWIDVHPDYTERSEVDRIISAVTSATDTQIANHQKPQGLS